MPSSSGHGNFETSTSTPDLPTSSRRGNSDLRASHYAGAGRVACVGLFSDPTTHLKLGVFLGRFGLDSLSADDLAAWYDDTSGLVVASLVERERRAVLESAAAHVRELNIEHLAERSELLPQGLVARLDELAKAIENALPGDAARGPKHEGIDGVERAWERVLQHLSARTPTSCRAAEAAVRLLRWLAVDTAPDGGLDVLARRYVDVDGWGDAALVTAHRGSDHRRLAEAITQVIALVTAHRRDHDRRFAAALADTPHPTGVLVEQLLPTVVLPLAKSTPTLLIVVDALSVAAATELAAAAAESGWMEAGVLGSSRRTGALAVLPTLTQRSRCSLLAGDLREGNDTAERTGFLNSCGTRSWKRHRGASTRSSTRRHSTPCPPERIWPPTSPMPSSTPPAARWWLRC